MAYRYIKPQDVQGKTVLLRVDLNEPLDEHGLLADDFRIQAVLPTIRMLMAHDAKVIIMAHLGRPSAEGDRARLTLKPAAEKLSGLMDLPSTDCQDSGSQGGRIAFCNRDLNDDSSIAHIKSAAQLGPVVLENIRFYEGEEANSDDFAKRLASLADVYVNDAFAVCHRSDASVVAITKHLPSFAGLVIEKEVKNLNILLSKTEHPFVLIMGGIKIADKAKTLENLGKKADFILIGGGIANLLFAAEGFEVGKSQVDREDIPLALQIINNFKTKIVLPTDVVVDALGKAEVRPIYEVKPSETIMDIGPKSLLTFAGIIKKSKMACWNGPLGYFENKSFRAGTMGLAQMLGGVGKRKSFVVAGGGETVSAIRMAHQEEHIDHLSTGGGAMLEYLAGNSLPGLEALKIK